MTGLVILAFIPLMVAAGFLIRARSEIKARRSAEQYIRQLQTQLAATGAIPPDWHAVLAHELRSPVAAILGYEELLEEGTFGELTPPALDAVRRIGFAADQLLALIDGIDRNSPRSEQVLPEPVSAHELIDAAVAAVRIDAEGRGTTITRQGDDVALATARENALHALVLALGAAIKASPNSSLAIAAADGSIPRISVRGTRLDPLRDSGGSDAPLTGSAFRLQLARATVQLAAGSVEIDTDGAIHLLLPRLEASADP